MKFIVLRWRERAAPRSEDGTGSWIKQLVNTCCYNQPKGSAADHHIRLNERSGFIFVTNVRMRFTLFCRTTLQESEESDDEG